MSVTRLTVGLLLATALAVPWIGGTLAAVVCVVVLGLAIGDALAVRRPPPLRRDIPPVLSRGVPADYTITDAGLGRRVRSRQPRADADIVFESSGLPGRVDGRVIALRRGSHRVPPVATIVTGPLGLGRWYHRVAGDDVITVFPDMPAARRLALQVRTGAFREEGRRSRGPLGLGTELESIREYLPDDDIRQVNWRATARVGVPMSNTYRIEQDRDVVCLVDAGRLMAAPVVREDGVVGTRLDVAVDVVAAIAAVAGEVGDRIGVIVFSDRVLASVRPRRDGERAVLAAVHDIEPSATDSDYELAVREVSRGKRGLVILLTDLFDETATEPLRDSLPVLARHHAVTVASITDPGVMRRLTTPAVDEVEATETAIALTLYRGVEAAAATLSHLGVDVVTAAPDLLAHRCVGAYLRAKRRVRV